MKRAIILALLVSVLLPVTWASQAWSAIIPQTVDVGTLSKTVSSGGTGITSDFTATKFVTDADVLLIQFTVSQANTEVNLWTNSFYQYNGDPTQQPPTFDVLLSLYDGPVSDPSAPLLASVDELTGNVFAGYSAYDEATQVRSMSNGGTTYYFIDGNSWIQAILDPGDYTLAVTYKYNLPADTDLSGGTITLGDGFNYTYLANNTTPHREPEILLTKAFGSSDGNFYVNLTGPSAAVPVPGAVWLLGTGLVGLWFSRRMRS